MLKHVSTGNANFKLSKYDSIGRVDTISLNSSVSSNDSSLNDSCSDPLATSPSRSSSSSSIHYIESQKVVIKIFTRVLCTDVEYKTLSIYPHTTCKEIVQMILNKFRLKNRDPKLFFLTLEAWIKQTGIPIRSVMTLDDDSCPALLQSCYTQKDLKFTLMMRRGSIVKINDTCLQQGPLYKSLFISDRTTVSELIQLLLNCCNCNDSHLKYELYEYCPSRKTERKLKSTDFPLTIQMDWPHPDFNVFQLRLCANDSKPKLFNAFRRNLKNEFALSLRTNVGGSGGLGGSSLQLPSTSTLTASSTSAANNTGGGGGSSNSKPDRLLYI